MMFLIMLFLGSVLSFMDSNFVKESVDIFVVSNSDTDFYRNMWIFTDIASKIPIAKIGGNIKKSLAKSLL